MKKYLLLILILFSAQVTLAKSKPSPDFDAGYVGVLPDVLEKFQKMQPKYAPAEFQSVDGFNDQNQIKPVPRDNPAFVNIILKTDKTSQYVNDINDLVQIVQKLENALETKVDVQKFNAVSNYLNDNIEYLRNKYRNKSEENYISFVRLMQLNNHVQAVSLLRSESALYSPYIPYSDKGYIYKPNVIEQQMNYLLKEVQDVLIVLQEVK